MVAAAARIGGSLERTAHPLQRFQKACASARVAEFQKSRSISLMAHARAVRRLDVRSASSFGRRSSERFSGFVSHRYLVRTSRLSSMATSALFSCLRTSSTAFVTYDMMWQRSYTTLVSASGIHVPTACRYRPHMSMAIALIPSRRSAPSDSSHPPSGAALRPASTCSTTPLSRLQTMVT